MPREHPLPTLPARARLSPGLSSPMVGMLWPLTDTVSGDIVVDIVPVPAEDAGKPFVTLASIIATGKHEIETHTKRGDTRAAELSELWVSRLEAFIAQGRQWYADNPKEKDEAAA